MHALEIETHILNHRLQVEDAALPERAERARVIILWDSPATCAKRAPPVSLAGMGEELGDILSTVSENDWDALT